MLTSFDIQGDAWMWWDGAAGRYQRGAQPASGSVLVFRRTGRLHYGHVATVSRVLDSRTILVDHSWGHGDSLMRGMKVVDTSAANNWSSVRVWNDPSDHLGETNYATYGFIYPRGTGHPGRGFEAPVTLASADVTFGMATDDAEDAPRAGQGPRTRSAALARTAKPTASVFAQAFLPRHKPQADRRVVVMAAAPGAIAASPTLRQKVPVVVMAAAPSLVAPSATVDLALPRRKPGAIMAANPHQVAELPQSLLPRHKPGRHHGTQLADARGRDAAEQDD
jgi:hypothetical protein